MDLIVSADRLWDSDKIIPETMTMKVKVTKSRIDFGRFWTLSVGGCAIASLCK